MKLKYYFVSLFIMLVFILSFSSNMVLADEIYINSTEDGNILLNESKGNIEGWTEPGTKITLLDKTKNTNDEGYFRFNNIDEGKYPITIKHSDYDTFIITISVKAGKTTVLEYIDLEIQKITSNNKGNNHSIDVTENNSNLIEEKSNDKEDRTIFSLDELSMLHTLYFLDVSYNKNFEHIDKNKSVFESGGLGTSSKVILPFNIYEQDFAISFELFELFNSKGRENVYFDNDIVDIYLTTIDYSNYDFNLSYTYDFDFLGDFKFLLGYNNFSKGLEIYSLRTRSGFDSFGKDYYDGKGLNYGIGYKTNFDFFINSSSKSNKNETAKSNNSIFSLSNFDFCFDYIRTRSMIETSSSRDSSSITVSGYKNRYNSYLQYDGDVKFIMGYFLTKSHSDQQVDGNFEWPSLSFEYSGPYVGISYSF